MKKIQKRMKKIMTKNQLKNMFCMPKMMNDMVMLCLDKWMDEQGSVIRYKINYVKLILLCMPGECKRDRNSNYKKGTIIVICPGGGRPAGCGLGNTVPP